MSNIFDLPVTGSIQQTSVPAEQRDPQLLADLFEELFAFPQFKAVSWEQFTPYFNDGDECIFSVHGYSTKVAFHDVEPDDNDYYDDGFFRVDDGDLLEYEYDRVTRTKRNLHIGNANLRAYLGEDADHFAQTIEKFVEELDSGGHDVFLKTKFGDHAEITATVDGFTVDCYEHY